MSKYKTTGEKYDAFYLYLHLHFSHVHLNVCPERWSKDFESFRDRIWDKGPNVGKLAFWKIEKIEIIWSKKRIRRDTYHNYTNGHEE